MEEQNSLSPEDVRSMSPAELGTVLKNLIETQATGEGLTPGGSACFICIPCSS